jgi:CRISPR system Cascade subunit CasD
VTDFLTFTLYAPLASWGDEAVGEVRGSWDRPSRSAILGLLGAALGLTRDAEAEHRELDAMLGIAVRVAASGRPFVDYHTAMNPTPVTIRRHKPRTRKIALEIDEPDTTLSQRTLRQDSLYRVALWQRLAGRWTLRALTHALRAPVFVLYAGRKANALGLPVDASVHAFESIAAALQTMPEFPREMQHLTPRDGWGREVSFDEPGSIEPGFALENGGPSLRRRDASPNRLRWQFAQREVHTGYLPTEANP